MYRKCYVLLTNVRDKSNIKLTYKHTKQTNKKRGMKMDKVKEKPKRDIGKGLASTL